MIESETGARDAQQRSLHVANTAMVVSSDIYRPRPHPLREVELGRPLGNLVRHEGVPAFCFRTDS